MTYPGDWYDREEQAIIDAHYNGEISRAQMDRALRDLRWDYEAAAHEEAQEAYDNALGAWGFDRR